MLPANSEKSTRRVLEEYRQSLTHGKNSPAFRSEGGQKGKKRASTCAAFFRSRCICSCVFGSSGVGRAAATGSGCSTGREGTGGTGGVGCSKSADSWVESRDLQRMRVNASSNTGGEAFRQTHANSPIAQELTHPNRLVR